MITTCRISYISKWPLSIELHPQSLCSWRESKKSADLFCVLVFIGAQENWVRIEFALEIAYEVECCGKQVTAPTSKMQDSKSCASSFDTSVASPAYSRCPAAGGSRADSRSHVLTLVILHAEMSHPTLDIWHCCCVARDIYHAHDSGFSNGNPIESVVPMGRRHAPKRSPNQAPAEYREAGHTKDWPSFLSRLFRSVISWWSNLQ